MSARAPAFFLQIVVVAAAIGAYHALGAGRKDEGASPAPPDEAAAVERLKADVERLRSEILERSASPPSAARDLAVRLPGLERRLAALEERESRALPLPRPTRPGAPPESRAHEDQVAALEGMLAEIERRKEEEREVADARRLVRGAGVAESSDQETRAAAAVVAYLRELRRIFPGGSGGQTLADRAAAARKAVEAREALDRALRGFLGDAAVERILGNFPPIPVPAETAPTDGTGAMGGSK